MSKPSSDEPKIEGEGSYSATRDYNERTKKFMKRVGDKGVAVQGERAAEALESEEGEGLRKAEEEGRRHKRD